MYSLLFALIVFLVQGARADIHYVSPGVPVQDIVNSAAPGDTVILEDGTHIATVVLYGKDLTIGSEYLFDGDTTHIAATIVRPDADYPDTASCFVYAYGESLAGRLIGLTLAEGRGTPYFDGSCDQCGGGVYVAATESEPAGVTIEHCRIEACEAKIGGGIWVAGHGNPASVVLLDCIVNDCLAYNGGGGVFLYAGSLTANRCIFTHDSATGQELYGIGAAILLNGYSQLWMDSCRITACAGMDATVGIYNFNTGVISHCLFGNNQILWGNDAIAADLVIYVSQVTVTGCHFDQNYSGSPAIYLYGTAYQYSRFIGNVVENGVDCLGVIALSGRRGDVSYNVIRNHSGLRFGAIGTTLNGEINPTVRVHHNVFTGNVSVDQATPSVLQAMDMRPTLDSNRIYGNSRPSADIWRLYYSGILDVRNNWWGHPSGPYHATLNPGGQGDTLLSDSVLFIPWLTEPPDTTMPDDYLGVQERPEVSGTWVLMDAYPNPFNQSITLTFAGFTGQDFEIGLYNLLGQIVDVVHRGALTGGQLHYQAPPWLASGLYLLSARDKHSIQTKKVILMK